jgi:hypothetical protein
MFAFWGGKKPDELIIRKPCKIFWNIFGLDGIDYCWVGIYWVGWETFS